MKDPPTEPILLELASWLQTRGFAVEDLGSSPVLRKRFRAGNLIIDLEIDVGGYFGVILAPKDADPTDIGIQEWAECLGLEVPSLEGLSSPLPERMKISVANSYSSLLKTLVPLLEKESPERLSEIYRCGKERNAEYWRLRELGRPTTRTG